MNSVVFLFGRSPYHQVCPHNLVGAFSLVPVQLVCKDAECAFAHFFSVLLYGGQFRVGALGDGSVGETADGNLVRHFQSHQLAGIQYTCRRFVINRKEAVGTVVTLQQVGVMAMARSRLSHSFIMLSSTGTLYFFMASR